MLLNLEALHVVQVFLYDGLDSRIEDDVVDLKSLHQSLNPWLATAGNLFGAASHSFDPDLGMLSFE